AGPRNGLGQVEAFASLRLAEVGRAKQLLQTDDLRALAGRLPYEPLGALHVVALIRCRVILNDADGKRAHSLQSTVFGLRFANCRLPATTTGYQLPTTSYRLPTRL